MPPGPPSRDEVAAETICLVCRGPIGVYEPLLVVDDDGPRVTSRAAEPWLAGGGLFHRDCYAQSTEPA